jgi:hypothetical protein
MISISIWLKDVDSNIDFWILIADKVVLALFISSKTGSIKNGRITQQNQSLVAVFTD